MPGGASNSTAAIGGITRLRTPGCTNVAASGTSFHRTILRPTQNSPVNTRLDIGASTPGSKPALIPTRFSTPRRVGLRKVPSINSTLIATAVSTFVITVSEFTSTKGSACGRPAVRRRLSRRQRGADDADAGHSDGGARERRDARGPGPSGGAKRDGRQPQPQTPNPANDGTAPPVPAASGATTNGAPQ